MKTIRHILTILLLIPTLTFAQNSETSKREQLLQAEMEYQVGRIDNTIDMLAPHAASYSGTVKVSAYRLLTLCYLAQDDLTNANKYIDLLLREDPYYSISLQDPERFAELIRKKKEGKVTLVTASQQAETLEEAPVPVTLITEEMIEAIGARNLQDVLITYVPGMTLIDGDEANISMNGVYSSLQEKILIMLNGHRMNSRCTNSEAPDFRISLDKIKQIEVLRGPASSLYGNVALTAVVNIITKEGGDLDGVYASYGMGNNETYRGDLLIGKRSINMDFLAWASIYSSEGEKRFISKDDEFFWGVIPKDGHIILGGYNRKPSYDIGFTFQWNHFKAMFNHQYSKKVASYSSVGYITTYNYDKYRAFNGANPGSGRASTRGEIQYSNKWNNLSFDASLFIDADESSRYDVGEDTIPREYGAVLPMPGEYIKDTMFFNKGYFQILDWKDYNYGLSLKSNYEYLTDKFRGNILVGAQFEKYYMYDNSFLMGDEFERIVLTSSFQNRMLEQGSELNFSLFAQSKHHFNDKWIFNGGIRYDYKQRFTKEGIHAFSPRLAFIFMPNHRWNLKIGYARSFVDAPFFYRANRTVAYAGSINLEPEYMDAVQLTFNYAMPALQLNYECNLYYKHLNEIIYFDQILQQYTNGGSLDFWGIDNSLSYADKKTKVNFTLAYQQTINSMNYQVFGDKINNVPAITSNLIATRKIWSSKNQSFSLRGNLMFYSKQNTPRKSSYLFKGGKPYPSEDHTLNERFILNLGGVYQYQQFECSIQCYNILNHHYTQGGNIYFDVPQQGRSFLAKVSYTFK